MHLESDWQKRTMVVRGTYVLFLNEHPNSKQLRYSYFDIFRIDLELIRFSGQVS